MVVGKLLKSTRSWNGTVRVIFRVVGNLMYTSPSDVVFVVGPLYVSCTKECRRGLCWTKGTPTRDEGFIRCSSVFSPIT